MSNYWLYTALLGAVIIMLLAGYAISLIIKLRQQLQQQAEAAQVQLKNTQQHDNKIYNSVIIIVRAMKEEQCDFSEGCWRLTVLLQSLTNKPQEQQFPAIFRLYDGIKHLAILDARKALTKQQRMKEDLERVKIEATLSAEIKAELEHLHQYAKQMITRD